MKASAFKESTGIWELALLDQGVKGLTYTDKAVYFEGIHCSAYRKLPSPLIDNANGPITVEGKTLTATLSLLDEEEDVRLRYSAPTSSVQLAAGTTRARVSTTEGGEWGWHLPKEEACVELTVDRAGLIEGASYMERIISREMSNPVLTGVQCTLAEGGDKLILRATNGHSRAGITFAKASGQAMQFVVAPTDLLIALRTMSAERVTVKYDGLKVLLREPETDIVLGTLAGEFPDLAKLPRDQPYKLTLPSKAVALIERAASTFDTDRLATLTVKGGRVLLQARGQERGAFETRVGAREAEDVAITFDALLLGVATSLGENVTLHYQDERTIVLMTGTPGRFYWLSPVLLAQP